MNAKLLTIIVPTYNRADCLRVLLRALASDLAGSASDVDIIVGNNASTDHTSAVTEEFLRALPSAIVLTHPANVGAEENFCLCLDRSRSRFIWIVGDDDIPKAGVIPKLLNLLKKHDPDLLYINSEWGDQWNSSEEGERIGELSPVRLNSIDFAKHVNVSVTFISGMIVNAGRLGELFPDLQKRRFSGTSLVQLGWVLPLLQKGSRFVVVPQPCVLATAGNTGGYSVISVFASRFDQVLKAALGHWSPAGRFISLYNRTVYLPRLLWLSRFGALGSFESENYVEALADQRRTIAYWAFLRPIVSSPRAMATSILLASRVAGIVLRLQSRVRRDIGRLCRSASDLGERGVHKCARYLNRFRGAMLSPFLAECRGPLSVGTGFQMLGRRHVSCLGPFTARKRNRIEAYARHGGQTYSPSIVFGANVSMEDDCHIGAVNRIELHDNVMLASKVYISDHSHGRTSLEDLQVSPAERTVVSKGPVIIESDVWIGEGVAILPGVRIGRGAVIGANSVVSRDIPAYSVAAGSPARVIVTRSVANAQTAAGLETDPRSNDMPAALTR